MDMSGHVFVTLLLNTGQSRAAKQTARPTETHARHTRSNLLVVTAAWDPSFSTQLPASLAAKSNSIDYQEHRNR